jgi:hypothetical protein
MCGGNNVVGRWWYGNGAVDGGSSVGNCCFVGLVKVFGSLVKMFEGVNFSEGLELAEMLDGVDLYDLKFDGYGFVGFDLFVVGDYFVVGVDLVGMDFVGMDFVEGFVNVCDGLGLVVMFGDLGLYGVRFDGFGFVGKKFDGFGFIGFEFVVGFVGWDCTVGVGKKFDGGDFGCWCCWCGQRDQPGGSWGISGWKQVPRGRGGRGGGVADDSES